MVLHPPTSLIVIKHRRGCEKHGIHVLTTVIHF
jgi:hypothetical protein